jgi:hypothetical protein
MDVPAKFAKPPPGIEELIHRPGASRERKGALFEKGEIASAVVPNEPSSVEPTLTAVEMHAGKLSAEEKPSFPEAITVAIPTERRLSMATLRGSVSQFEEDRPPPMLMLTEAKE